ncbi:biotin--[acetyl-CoA-carboxylase] ligase [Demequina lutea]|uniref:biotin--[biotin carboxyl-carrier protein] ligase n=1 Tax=Demequina lutea TaxID=431489 RepID=A0A7Y9Z6V7_9MICO|nr:biotin--[acetyl-CoA-carboxylase] ligase [Demequina lutea]NYI39892.1 BirA family biotin operon repressor/biotin-[acetyl-CoA-carboxylase] ligase [Demequina lutea]
MDTFNADAGAGAPLHSVAASRAALTADSLASLTGEHAALPLLVVTKASPSTNSELLEALAVEPDAWPHMSALVADHQTAGRGRAGREWLTPEGAALTVSYVLRPRLPRERWGLVPLVVGLAAVKTMRSVGIEASLKWPNDVVVNCADETEGGVKGDIAGWGSMRKIAGILCEVYEDAVVAGIGVNVSQTRAELPVPHATSMAMVGVRLLDRALLLDALSRQLAAEINSAEADPDAFVAELASVTCTLGRQVLVERTGASPLTGVAEGIGADGSLTVRTAAGEAVAVTAGDVRLRGAT